MSSLKRHEGYLYISNRFNPAISGNKDFPAIPQDSVYECLTITCAHCNTVVILRPDRKRERGYCSKCDKYICDNPACHQGCFSFDKLLDEMQEQAFLQGAHWEEALAE